MQTISHMARHAYDLIQSSLKMIEKKKTASGYQFVEYRHFIATPTDHTLIQQQLKCTVVYSNHITKDVPNTKQYRIGQMFVVHSVNINSTMKGTTRSFAHSVD